MLDVDPSHGRAEGPPAARAACSSSTRARAASSATTRSRRASRPSIPTRSGSTSTSSTSTTCPTASTSCYSARLGRAAPADVRLHARRAQDPPRADGARPAGAPRLDGHRHADRRAVGSAPPALRLLPAAVRAGDEPAARRHPRGAGHVARRRRSAPRATCSSRPGVVPPDRAPVPIIDNDELAKLDPHQRRRRHARLRRRHLHGLYPVAGGGAGARGRRSTTSAPRSARRSPTAPASSCSPTATRPRSSRRSRRCCSPRPCTTTSIREKTRTQVGLVVETGDAREVHHMALLLGYGAGAINPYLAFETIEDLIAEGVVTGIDDPQGRQELHQGGAARASSR